MSVPLSNCTKFGTVFLPLEKKNVLNRKEKVIASGGIFMRENVAGIQNSCP